MSLLAYAILSADAVLPDKLPAGPEGSTVGLLGEGNLAAAYSRVSGRLVSPRVHDLLAYAAVIEALHQQAGVLPLRFGCLLESADRLRELLRQRCDEWQSSLEVVRDCVEMTVRLLPLQGIAPVEAPSRKEGADLSPGRAYLAQQRERFAAGEERRAQAERLALELRAAFAALPVDALAEPAPASPAAPLTFHYLVRRADCARFTEAFARLQASRPERLLLTGPWPPYQFASAGPGVLS